MPQQQQQSLLQNRNILYNINTADENKNNIPIVNNVTNTVVAMKSAQI